MPTNTVTENSLRRDLAAAYQLAARRGWDDTVWTHITAALAHAKWVGDGRTPEGQDEWPALLRELQALDEPLFFLQESPHAHHPCRIV
jgi:ribulose-5-phosphate 4-epimerase/fuculose-1-phosphate aldolase